jgi:tRNA1(Val) A37 N6-methylase TrmN6
MSQDVTDDAFLGGLVRIEQPARGYRAGVDAVLLAATICAPAEDPLAPHPATAAIDILDAGSGVGTVGLCVAARCPHARIVLMEREAALVRIAKRNVALNGFDARMRVVTAEVGAPAVDLTRVRLPEASFDCVLANPPYHAEGRGTLAPDPLKARSHAMPEADLEGWIRFMARMAKPGGQATLVHKAEALGLILTAMRGRFGAVIVLPIHPRHGAAATRVIVRGTKGSRAPLQLRPGFVLHGDGNAFLPAADAIFRTGADLRLDGT